MLIVIAGVTCLGILFYPKPMIMYPDGGWLFSSKGRVCRCLGYATPIVKMYDMGKGIREPVYQQAKCYGIVYDCGEFTIRAK